MAFFIPTALFLLCLVKKLTVKGIIGKTQGVSRAAKPDKKAIKKIAHSPLVFELVDEELFLVDFSQLTLFISLEL